MNEIIKKIDEAIEMYKNRISVRQGANYHDESERIIRFEERLNEAIRIKEIIQAEQKEPCGYCKGLNNNYAEIQMKNYEIEWAHTFGKINYCPMCGRPLNQKAEEE